MDAMLEYLSTWMPVLLRTSLQAALLVAVIVAVQRIFAKRLSPAWRHAMWGLLIVRLLLVWAPASPLSVYNLAVREMPVARVSVVEIPAREAPAETPSSSAGPVLPEAGLATVTSESEDFSDLGDGNELGNVLNRVDLRAAASLLWLGVFGGITLAMLAQSLHFGRQVRRGRIVTDSETLELLEECRASLRVSPFLALVETDCVRSPALLGCIRPKLLLPCGFLDSLSQEEMGHVFLHELAHVKRGDIWSGWIFNLLLAAHWFNPALWFARRRFIADREAACDAHVLAALDASGQRGYGHTVLNLTQRFNPSPWGPGMAGISETNSNLKRRITMIKQFRPPTRLAAWSGAGLCVCIGLATLTNAQDVTTAADPAAAPTPEVVEGPAAKTSNPDVLRQEAKTLAEKGRYLEAISVLDKGRFEDGSVFEEFSALILKYKIDGGLPMSASEKKPFEVQKAGDSTRLVYAVKGDLQCTPQDIYGYTATNGGTMIAAQLTNTGSQDVTVDVEFWEGGIDSGMKIGRGGLAVPAGKTATEAIPWAVENGTHAISVSIDPDNTVAESDENNNRTEVSIEYTNGRFLQLASISANHAGQEVPVVTAAKRATLAPGQVLREGETWIVTDEEGVIVERSTVLLNKEHVAGTDSGEDLKYLGIVFKMFSMENRGEMFPPLSRVPWRLMFAWEGDGRPHTDGVVMSVKNLTELAYVGCLDCDAGVDVPDDSRFAYLGYLVRNDEDVLRFAEAYEGWASTGGTDSWFADDKPHSPDEGPVRLREGIERFFITDINNPAEAALAQAQIPTLIEWPDRYVDEQGNQGGNVLFMDGHVEFIPYPGKWPMTQETIGILCKLARRPVVGVTHRD